MRRRARGIKIFIYLAVCDARQIFGSQSGTRAFLCKTVSFATGLIYFFLFALTFHRQPAQSNGFMQIKIIALAFDERCGVVIGKMCGLIQRQPSCGLSPSSTSSSTSTIDADADGGIRLRLCSRS